MEAWKVGIALFCGIAVAQSFFLGTYLLVKGRLQNKATFFLSLMLIALALRIGKSLIYYHFPHMALWGITTGGAGFLAIGPSFWLYTKSGKANALQPLDYLHYLPAVIFLATGWLTNMHVMVFVYRLSALLLPFYLLGGFWLHRQEQWQGIPSRFKLFFASTAAIALAFILQMLADSIQWYAIGAAIASIVLYVINFLITKDQSLLKAAKNGNKKIDKTTQKAIAKALEILFAKEKIYRQKGLTLSTVATQIDRPTYLLSKVINQYYGLKFNDFVNQYRVEEVKRLLHDVERNHTIEAIATDVGFSSTSSLYQAFKKATNTTPQAFRKQLPVNHKS